MKASDHRAETPSLRNSFWVSSLLFGVAYFGLASIGHFVSRHDQFVTFWLPSGLFVATLLLHEPRQWPWLVLAAVLANLGFDLLNGQQPWISFFFCCGNCLEALAGAWLTRRFVAPQPGISSRREVVGLLLFSALFSTALSASVGATVVTRLLGGDSFGHVWLLWWSGDVIGVMLLAPLVLSWLSRPAGAPIPSAQIHEALALLAGLCLCAFYVFHGEWHPDFTLKYLLVPFVLWAALRFGIRLTTVVNLVVALFASWFTMGGLNHASPTGLSLREQVSALQLYLAVTALTGWILAAVVSDWKRAEMALRNNEQNLQSLFDAINESVCLFDPGGQVLAANETFAQRLGKRTSDCIGASIFSLIPPEVAARRRAIVEKVLQTGQPTVFEDERQGRWLHHRMHPVLNQAGTVIRLVVTAVDITERKRSEQELWHKNEQLEMAQRSAGAGMWDWDMATGRIDWSRALFVLFGLDPDRAEAGFDAWRQVIHPEDRQLAADGVDQAVRDGTPLASEYRVLLPGGGLRWISALGDTIRGGDGGCRRMSGICLDITGRKHAEETLRISQATLAAIIDSTADLIWSVDKDFRLQAFNRSLFDYYLQHRHLRIVPGMLPEDMLPTAEYVQLWRGFYQRALVDGPFMVDYQAYSGERLLRLSFSPLRQGGEVFGVSIFGKDITERKRAEEALHKSQNQIAQLLQSTDQGIYGINLDGACTFINRAGMKILGYASEECIGRNIHDLIHHSHPDGSPYRAEACPTYRAMLTGEGSRIENEVFWRKGGISFPVEYSSFPLFENGQIHGAVMAFSDITERKALEAQLRQSQKLEAIGQLAGGVAHDFNNIMAAVMMNLGLLEMRDDLGPEVMELIKELQVEIERAASLTRQLLIFSRKSVLEKKVIDLGEAAANLLRMLGRLIGEHIHLEYASKGELPLVEADVGMVEQVLMNLAVNARDAMPKGGKLAISLEAVNVDAERMHGREGAAPGAFVRIRVEDSGCGMDKATMARIFEPFFTTKEVGKGTGMGLATVYGIMAQHKGWIEVESAPGRGATFQVFFPASQGEIAKPAQPRDTVVARGNETLLVVEDEASVRRAQAKSLRHHGYRVYEAANGPEALELWRQHAREIDLLVSDMVMSEGMTGIELAGKLRAERPDLKVIISSGYNAEMSGGGFSAAAGNLKYLQKTHTINVLCRAIRECLGPPPG